MTTEHDDKVATPTDDDDRDLLDRVQSGSTEAQEELVRTHIGQALAVARRFLDDEADVEDAVQEAFIAAFRHVETFNRKSRLATWLHRIVVNAALMKLRRRRQRRERSLDDLLPSFYVNGHRIDPRPAWPQSPAEICEREDLRRRVNVRIAELPENYRDVLTLRDIQEKSTREVAEHLGEPEGTVKMRLHRARQALRRLLEEELVP